MHGEAGAPREQEKLATDISANCKMSQGYSPGSREIVATIIDIWKNYPETENLSYAKLLACVKEAKTKDNWVLSEKRMKAALKEFNLQPNQPKFTFVKETKSDLVPSIHCPLGTKLLMTKAKGKALYATKNFKAGEKIWEEIPTVQAVSVEMLRLTRGGRCCAYCAKLLRTAADGAPLPREGIACYHCTANWCSNNCKRLDIGHPDTHHDTKTTRPHILQSKWKLYEQFCLDQNWNAGYAFALVLLHKIKHGPNSQYAKTIMGMARIRQDIRQKAVSDPGSLEFEQHEQMWKRGHQILASAVKPVHNLSYEEFLEGIGLVNLNNVKGCIFEVHANLNHSCEPNVKVLFRSASKSDGITVLANEAIEAGQELQTSYVNPELGLDERQSELRSNWGFICSCARCKREKANRLPPAKPQKPALKSASSSLTESPVASPTTAMPQATTVRRKSVHFKKNPVTLEVSSC